MSRKDITDFQVCEAYRRSALADRRERPEEILERETGQPAKVVMRAIERCVGRDYIEYGVSLSAGWLTDKGNEFLNQELMKLRATPFPKTKII